MRRDDDAVDVIRFGKVQNCPAGMTLSQLRLRAGQTLCAFSQVMRHRLASRSDHVAGNFHCGLGWNRLQYMQHGVGCVWTAQGSGRSERRSRVMFWGEKEGDEDIFVHAPGSFAVDWV